MTIYPIASFASMIEEGTLFTAIYCSELHCCFRIERLYFEQSVWILTEQLITIVIIDLNEILLRTCLALWYSYSYSFPLVSSYVFSYDSKRYPTAQSQQYFVRSCFACFACFAKYLVLLLYRFIQCQSYHTTMAANPAALLASFTKV
jgi:hypothetical protein